MSEAGRAIGIGLVATALALVTGALVELAQFEGVTVAVVFTQWPCTSLSATLTAAAVGLATGTCLSLGWVRRRLGILTVGALLIAGLILLRVLVEHASQATPSLALPSGGQWWCQHDHSATPPPRSPLPALRGLAAVVVILGVAALRGLPGQPARPARAFGLVLCGVLLVTGPGWVATQQRYGRDASLQLRFGGADYAAPKVRVAAHEVVRLDVIDRRRLWLYLPWGTIRRLRRATEHDYLPLFGLAGRWWGTAELHPRGFVDLHLWDCEAAALYRLLSEPAGAGSSGSAE